MMFKIYWNWQLPYFYEYSTPMNKLCTRIFTMKVPCVNYWQPCIHLYDANATQVACVVSITLPFLKPVCPQTNTSSHVHYLRFDLESPLSISRALSSSLAKTWSLTPSLHSQFASYLLHNILFSKFPDSVATDFTFPRVLPSPVCPVCLLFPFQYFVY